MSVAIDSELFNGRWRLDRLEGGRWTHLRDTYYATESVAVPAGTYRMVVLTADPETGQAVERKQSQFTLTRRRALNLELWAEDFQSDKLYL